VAQIPVGANNCQKRPGSKTAAFTTASPRDQKQLEDLSGNILAMAKSRSGARSSLLRRPNEREDRSLQQRDEAKFMRWLRRPP
jgi:hypothetical protein